MDIGESLGRGYTDVDSLGGAALRGAAAGTGGLLAYRLANDVLRYAGLPGGIGVPAGAIAGLAAWQGLRKWLSPYAEEDQEEDEDEQTRELQARFLAALRSRHAGLRG